MLYHILYHAPLILQYQCYLCWASVISADASIHPFIHSYILHEICHSQGNINSNHLPPSLSQINSRGTLNMAPSRRVTERRDQLVASVDRGHPHPFSVPGWVGGIWRPRQGPLWCDTHTHTHTRTCTHTHRRPGATQAGPTIAVGDTVSPSLWQRRGSVYVGVFVIPPWKHPHPPSWERWLLPATTSPWWLRCCLCSSKLERFSSVCTYDTCMHTEPTGGRPCSAQQAHFKG